MKKIFALLTVLLLGIVIAGCSDDKVYDETVNVIFFTNSNAGGTEISPALNLEPGELLERPEDPERHGYIFKGWFTDLDYTQEWEFEENPVKDNSFVLYAGWEEMESIIIYDSNGGTMPNTNYPVEYKTGDRNVLPIPTRTGFTFLAWYTYDWDEENPNTKPGDSGYQTIPANAVGELYLYAHWKPITASVTFRVNYPGDEAERPATPSNMTLNYGAEINFPIFEDTANYTFLGWNTRADGEGDWINNGDIFTRTQRMTVSAIWEPIN